MQGLSIDLHNLIDKIERSSGNNERSNPNAMALHCLDNYDLYL